MIGAVWVAIGAVVFIAITFLEQVPVLGWVGGVVSIGAWVGLTRALLGEDRSRIARGTGVVWAGILGASSGFVGAMTAWLAQTGNLFGFTTAPGDRFGAAFGFLGASLGLLYWPLIGLIVCAITAAALGPRR